MIRAVRLAVSRPMYAFNPATWREPWPMRFEVDAVWFRRKNGRLMAAMGSYHPMVQQFQPRPTDGRYESWIAAANDSRYGANHWSSWDGESLLTTDPPRVPPVLAAERTAFLDAVLRGFPDPPPRWDGWWTFPKGEGQ